MKSVSTSKAKSVDNKQVKQVDTPITKTETSKVSLVLQCETGRDLVCQFLEYLTLIILTTQLRSSTKIQVEAMREKIIMLRMAMRFGKVFPLLRSMPMSFFQVTGTLSAALFYLIDNALFLNMFRLLPMTPLFAAYAGRLEIQLWAGISASFFLDTLTERTKSLEGKVGKLFIIALDLSPIIFFLNPESEFSGPLLAGICGSLSAML